MKSSTSLSCKDEDIGSFLNLHLCTFKNCVDKGIFSHPLKMMLHQFRKRNSKVIKAIIGLKVYK